MHSDTRRACLRKAPLAKPMARQLIWDGCQSAVAGMPVPPPTLGDPNVRGTTSVVAGNHVDGAAAPITCNVPWCIIALQGIHAEGKIGDKKFEVLGLAFGNFRVLLQDTKLFGV